MADVQKQIILPKNKNFIRLTNTSTVDTTIINRIEPHDEVYDGYEITLQLEATSGAKPIILQSQPVGSETTNLNLGKYKIDEAAPLGDIIVSDPTQDQGYAQNSTHHYNTFSLASPGDFDNLTFDDTETDIIVRTPSASRSGDFSMHFDAYIEVSGSGFVTVTFRARYGALGLKEFQTWVERGRPYHINLMHAFSYDSGSQVKFTAESSSPDTVSISHATYMENGYNFINPGILSPNNYARKMKVKLQWNETDNFWEEVTRANLLS